MIKIQKRNYNSLKQLRDFQKLKEKMSTLYQKLGGRDAIGAVVNQFHQYCLIDDRINIFFIQNVSDIPKIHGSLTHFLTFLFGGPNRYQGPNLIDLHKNMPIKMGHFHIVWGHVQSAFKYCKVSDQLIQQARRRMYALHTQVIQPHNLTN